MGFVSGFVDEIVSPLETAAGQIRQLGQAHIEANYHLQTRAKGLATTFQGAGAQVFFTMAQRQGNFITGITNELNDFAGAFDETVHIVREAAQVADWALGGPLLDLAQHLLSKLSPEIVVRQGQSAVSAVASDMRQTFHDMLHQGGSMFGDLIHGHFGAALHDAGNAFGDLIHLGGDLFALLDQVETILGHWAAKVMEKANWLLNSIQSILFKIEDFVFGFSQISDNAAILADPNSTPEEKGIAIAGLGITAISDILMFIPGAEEGGVALDATEKTLIDKAESEVEQQVEKEVEQEVEQQVEKDIEQQVEGDVEKQIQQQLIDEVKNSGAKISEQDVVGITRTPDGSIDWLETGNPKAGLEHIMNGDGTPGDMGHAQDFANIGVEGEDNVSKLIIDTLRDETPVATRGNGQIFDVTIDGTERQILIVVGSNGFIVTAYPV